MSINHPACSGLRIDNFVLMSISLIFLLLSNSLFTWSARERVNFLFIIFLYDHLDHLEHLVLEIENFLKLDVVFIQQILNLFRRVTFEHIHDQQGRVLRIKSEILMLLFYVGDDDMFRHLVLQCFLLADNRKLSGKETGGMLFHVFPPQMICIGKNLPSVVILNVAVIVLLSVDPATEKLLILLGASVFLQPGTYFDGVWSRFISIDFGILLFSIMETVECK